MLEVVNNQGIKVKKHCPTDDSDLKLGNTDSNANVPNTNVSVYKLNLCNSNFYKNNVPESAENCEAIDVHFKQLLLPQCHYTQSMEYLYVNIKYANINDFAIVHLDSSTFKFLYTFKLNEHGVKPIYYCGVVCTTPYAIKNNGIVLQILDDTLVILVEKQQPALWQSLQYGTHKEELKKVNLKQPQSIENIENKCPNEIFPYKYVKNVRKDSSVGFDGGEGVREMKNEEHKEKVQKLPARSSKYVNIPNGLKTSKCFLTGSWPRGILKTRSRLLSDSSMDSWINSSMEGDIEVILEANDKDGETSEYEEVSVENSPTKKSVHFNDRVSKKLFRVNAALLRKNSKNNKHALQGPKEKELSDASHSSETDLSVDQASDTGTTTEDEVNAKGESKENFTSYKGKKQEKRKRKKKHKKTVLTLSSEITEMIFQLDDD